MRSFSLILLGVLLISSCAGPETRSVAEQVQEYTSVLKKLGSPAESERTEAIQRFLTAGKERGSEVVVFFLEDRRAVQSERVRVNLAGLLAQWKDSRGPAYLIELFHSQDPWVRNIIDQSLVVYGDSERVIEYLGEQLSESSSVETRRLAASILSHVGNERAAYHLSRRRRDTDLEVRAECLIGIIASPRNRDRLGYLIDGLTDPDPGLRELAWAAILKTVKEKPPVQFSPESEDERERATQVAIIRRWAGFSRVPTTRT